MQSETIEHQGIVESVEGNKAKVRIYTASACEGCHAKGACQADGDGERVIIANFITPPNTGDLVKVSGSVKQGYFAVLLAYVIPFIIIIIALIVFNSLKFNEILSGLISLSLLIPYYLIIRLINNKIENHFTFTIKENLSI